MEPGRTGIVRQAGTNLATGGTTLSGLPFDVTLASVEAINIAPTIRVYMNYRNLDQRGIIYPVPTTPNNSPNAAQITGNTALAKLVCDSASSSSGRSLLPLFVE